MIQSGTITFTNPYGKQASAELTFDTPFSSTDIRFALTPQLTGNQINFPVTLSYDPTTLTTTGVTFSILVGGSVFGRANVNTIVVDWTASDEGSSGPSGSTFTESYTAADFTTGTLTITSADHNCGNGPFLIQFLDASTPANQLEAQYTVNTTNGTIVITDPEAAGYDFTIIMSSL